jgi:hypothetical protein
LCECLRVEADRPGKCREHVAGDQQLAELR